MANYACTFVTTRIVYPIVLLAICVFAFLLSCDFLLTAEPFVGALYDLNDVRPNNAVSVMIEPAQSAVMNLRYPGYIYQFEQLNGDLCLGYTVERFVDLPTEIVYFKPDMYDEAGKEFVDGIWYQCVIYDNLEAVERSFYLGGMQITLIAAAVVSALIAIFGLLFVCCCCSGWCSCACNAWCLMCTGSKTSATYEVYRDKTAVYVKQI